MLKVLLKNDNDQIRFSLSTILRMIVDDYCFIDKDHHIDSSDVLITSYDTYPHSKAIYVNSEDLLRFYDLFVLKEESTSRRKDAHGRFIASYSSRDVRNAEANEYAESLKRNIEKFNSQTKKKAVTVVLTHDVDNLTKRNVYVHAKKMKNAILKPNNAINQIKSLFSKIDDYDDIYDFMAAEDKYGFRSSFYFLTGRKGRFGARYTIDEAKPYIKALHDGGWEVGQHINYYNYLDQSQIQKNKNKIEDVLGESIAGCRHHYLRFHQSLSFRTLYEAGFLYDSTLGYPDEIGFRNGIAYPFIPFEFHKLKRKFVELPLTIMDGALLNDNKLSIDNYFKILIEMLEKYRETNAVITLLWHPGTFANNDYPGWGELYKRLLKYLSENDFAVKRAVDVVREYLKN